MRLIWLLLLVYFIWFI